MEPHKIQDPLQFEVVTENCHGTETNINSGFGFL